MSKLVLRSVAKSYTRGTSVLKPFDLVVQSGELVVLVGPSGCGKSTLLKLMAGLEQLDEGQILLGERDITRLEPRHRRIAMVFQNYALYPHLTVHDNLAYPLRRAGTAKAEIRTRVETVAAQLRLGELLDRRPSQLSGGQKQRVAMGRAIIREPELFLLDEPLSNLDAGLRTHVRGEIRELQRRLGTTMIYVTHDQVEAQTLADRVVVMRGGEIQQVGTPRDIYARPTNMFVAAFLGTAPPNFMPARIRDRAIELEPGSLPLVALPAELRMALAGHDRIFIGIRPEALQPARLGGSELTLTGRVVRREFVGNMQNIHLAQDRPAETLATLSRLTGRHVTGELVWTTDAANMVERVELGLRPEDLLLFDIHGEAIGLAKGEPI